jgi:hypothetical protein
MLTGQAPISVTRRTSDPEAFHAPRVANAHISPEVERVILRALEMERARRFASANDMRTALQMAHQALSGESIGTVALPPTPHTPLAPPRRALSSRLTMIGLVVAAVATEIPRADVQITLLSSNTTPEYLLLQNEGTVAQDMSGWYLESTVGPQTFNFPIGFTLPPSATVRIESYTGARNEPPQTLLWSTDAIWNNAGDKAILRNAAGAVISSKCYGNQCQ